LKCKVLHNSEFTPPGYTVIARRDRQDGYDGVFIMAKSITPCDELYTSKQSELVAISVERSNMKLAFLARILCRFNDIIRKQLWAFLFALLFSFW
jgi:hypothetical protein